VFACGQRFAETDGVSGISRQLAPDRTICDECGIGYPLRAHSCRVATARGAGRSSGGSNGLTCIAADKAWTRTTPGALGLLRVSTPILPVPSVSAPPRWAVPSTF